MKIRNCVLLAATLGAAGCAVNPQTGQPEIAPSVKSQFKTAFNNDDPCSNNDRNIGAVAGAVAGGLIGYLSHGAKGAAIGAAAGAGGGLIIGHLMDARRCSLYKIAQANHLNLASASITPGKLGLQGNAANSEIGLDVQLQNRRDEFETGSSTLTPAARQYLAQIAQLYAPQAGASGQPAGASIQERQQATQHSVLIVGHTDAQDEASGADLARLSQERAKAVAEVFAQGGVPASNIYYQGAGDALPLMSNATEEGRAANDRVQIVDVPTQGDLQLYLQRRAANPANFGNVASVADRSSEESGPSASRPTNTSQAAKAVDVSAAQAQAKASGPTSTKSQATLRLRKQNPKVRLPFMPRRRRQEKFLRPAEPTPATMISEAAGSTRRASRSI
jgi:outer membrane protein OmpA-like peptidoglycan-associated protein